VVEAGHAGADANRDGTVDCAGGFGANGFCDALETAPESGMAMTPPRDTDQDSIADFRDLDSDDDGLGDRNENGTACNDAPADGVCNGGDADRDGSPDTADMTTGFGVGDYPVPPDTDGDGTPDYRDLDSDGDGLFDNDESGHGMQDTNNDGKVDGPDADGDGLKDGVDDADAVFGGASDDEPDTDGDGKPDYRDLDSDGDGLSDTDEAGDDPDPRDTDGDGKPDFQDVDSDADATGDETDNCLLLSNPDQADLDGDGLGDECDDDDNNDGFEDGLGVQGGGCSTSGGSSGALVVFAIAGVLLARRRRKLVVAAALVAAGSTGAAAQVSSEYSAERFELTGHRDGLLGVEWADVPGHLVIDAGLWLGYANDPVNIYQMSTGERVGSLVANRVGGELSVAVQVARRIELGIGAPLIVAQSDDLGATMAGSQGLSGFGLGDLRLRPKLTLVRSGAFAAAAYASITLPTSTTDDYGGDNGVSTSIGLALSAGRPVGVRFAINGGYRVRPEAQALDLVVDDEVFGSVGLGYRWASSLELDATFDLATGADDIFGAFNRNAAEVRAGIGYDVIRTLRLFGAGGIGIAEGFATPDWRALAGVRLHSPEEERRRPLPKPVEDLDPDRDGIVGAADVCPNEPEDVDAFSDGDGCPDPDNDGDTVLDTVDRCRDVPGVPEMEGCPDPDRDGDTIVDRLDMCPLVPGLPALQGCPDRDGDTVTDAIDNCPDEPGLVENQGCKKKQLVKIADGKLEILDIVYFALNKALIQRRSNRLLDDVAAVLVAHPEITKIQVEGHTDSQGNDAYNKKLSQKRAEAVVDYLVKKGVARDRLEAIGFGEEKPKDTNDTKEGRAVNRRVEFILVGGVGVEVKSTGPDGETIEK
ncbi:MAG: OmpA family protein, partial [Kofleriaceae bacterium]